MSRQYRVAIIGYGRSGRDIHCKLIHQLPELYSIVAISDSDAQRRGMIAAETGAEALENYTALFGRQDVDFVINASFSQDHHPISVDLLRHGFNVLAEKPAAANTAEFTEILETARESGKLYQVFQQYRYAPSYKKMKEVIASGVLGRIVQANLNYSGFSRRWDWQTVQSFRGGSLLNTGPHPVDQALDLMGFPQDVQVAAAFDRAQTSGDAEDYAKLLLQAPGAPVVDVEISSCNAYSDKNYLVQGRNGTLKGTTQHLEWKYYIEADEPERPLITSPLRGERGEPQYCREQLTFYTEEWEAQGEDVDDFNAKGLSFYQSFHQLLTTGIPMEVTNDQVLLQMKVMEEAHYQNDSRLQPFVKE